VRGVARTTAHGGRESLAYGDTDSPDCGHRYELTSVDPPDDAYQVTATSCWDIRWSGADQGGTVSLDLSRSVPVRIGRCRCSRSRTDRS